MRQDFGFGVRNRRQEATSHPPKSYQEKPVVNRPYRYLSTLISLSALSALFCALPAHAQQSNPFAPPLGTVHYARSRDYHVRHLKLIMNIDAKGHSAQGVVTHTLSPLRDRLETIVLDAGNNLKIESCRLNGDTVPFTHEKNLLTIRPPSPLPRGKEVTVEIRYTMPGGITA